MQAFGTIGTGGAAYSGIAEDHVLFTERKQLKDRALWHKFASVFGAGADDADRGWRSEYWGKMMRGACLVYRLTADEELYGILTETVRELLQKQEKDGRISSYSPETELTGWDIWGRKYVLTGLLHYRGICRDEALKAEILRAACRHADALVRRVGKGEGQAPITQTSDFWGGLNSCSVCEPIVELYKLTGEKRYLAFAEYILSTGGSEDGDLLALAEEDKLFPYQYPVTKAYEMMSFFEGALAYSEATGKTQYFETVKKFVEKVYESDITVIGCAGCTHELFDHSAAKQTEPPEIYMQETCVTVTWIRLLSRLLLLTGDMRYADRIEISARNALFGSVNTHDCPIYSPCNKKWMYGFPFDSYSPLYNDRRGREVGGGREFADGSFYGCCVSIAAAGIALFPLLNVLRAEKGIAEIFYLDGTARITTPGGQTAALACSGNAVKTGRARIAVSLPQKEKFSLLLHIPAWSKTARIVCGGEEYTAETGMFRLERDWQTGDSVEIYFDMQLREMRLNGKTALLRGPLVLARDEQKEAGDITAELCPLRENGSIACEILPEEKGEQLRVRIPCRDGDHILTDYASCGKNWNEPHCNITAWLNIK